MPTRNSTNGNGRLTPAFSYIRMSSDGQEESPDQQREQLTKLAAEHHHKIVREYFDAGISGDATGKRKDFQRMIADCGTGGVKAILCWDQDRFGRFDSIEAGHWIYPLRQLGVKLITCAQGIIDWSDFTGRVMYTIQQEGKHQFLHDLSRNSGRGILAARRDGRWTDRPPYGYRIGDDGHLAFGPSEEVEAVRAMYQLRSRGESYHAIAVWANSQGVKPPEAQRWTAPLITHLLKRRTYRGVVITGEQPQAKYHAVTQTPVYVENAHPPLIDSQTWDTVQAMRQKPRRAHSRRGSGGTPLAGLLYCGRCGSVLYARKRAGRRSRKPIYHCSANYQGFGCGYCTVPQEATLAMVADAIREHVLRGSLARLEEAIQRRMGRRENQPATTARKIRQEISAIERKLDRATSRILEVDDSLVPRVEAQMLDLTKRRDTLQNQLQAVSEPHRSPDSAKQIAAKIWELDSILATALPAVVREALSRIIGRIVLDFEPASRNKRGQQFRFSGGRIELCTEGAQSHGRVLRWRAPEDVVNDNVPNDQAVKELSRETKRSIVGHGVETVADLSRLGTGPGDGPCRR